MSHEDSKEWVRVVREGEHLDRCEMFIHWRDCDIFQARDWAVIAANTGIDTSADVRRNVGYARRWNHELIRMKRARRMN